MITRRYERLRVLPCINATLRQQQLWKNAAIRLIISGPVCIMPARSRVPETQLMQANNPTLGDDFPRDDDQSLTEHPTADSQEQPEMMAYDEQPQSEDDLGAAALEGGAEAEPQAGDVGGDDTVAAAGEDAGGEETVRQAAAETVSDAADQPVEDFAGALPGDDEGDERAAGVEEASDEPEGEAPPFRKGQIVDGTVLETSPTEVWWTWARIHRCCRQPRARAHGSRRDRDAEHRQPGDCFRAEGAWRRWTPGALAGAR